MKKELLAHVKKDDNNKWQIHSLEDHLRGVTKLAIGFASYFGLEKLSEIQGLVHDAGKASSDFQRKIASNSGYDPDIHTNKAVDHSTAGAQYIIEKYGEGAIPLAYNIMGHHGGLPNGNDEHDSCMKNRLKKKVPEYRDSLPNITLPEQIFPSDYKTRNSKQTMKAHFLIRMLYSALTDADFLDTERFMSSEKSELRVLDYDFESLREKLEKDLSLYTDRNGINGLRADILRWCKNAAELPQGIFSLTVPTGGGKTKSSVAFAIEHGIRHKLRRIIYVIPYTSIISQNAGVFRSIFGEENVLEHHSNLDPDKENARNRLLCENWDSPIIVTTNIQFFESFYSNRSSSCRKLHNVSDSIIIFDEAQMLPTEFLKPCLEVINELVQNYGCSAVLCTATQPTLNSKAYLKNNALNNVKEIIPSPKSLYYKLKRVNVHYNDELLSNTEIGDRISKLKQVLVIVNTRRDSREIFEQLYTNDEDSDSIFHLSTFMCPKHREQVLKIIRKRLDSGCSCKVVSTQLVEAGVDIDFPVVYRAIAGLDSIAQAAGRCNREGRLGKGDVYIFKGENPPPPGHLRQSAESGGKALDLYEDDPLCLDAIKFYFNDFYWKRSGVHSMDKKNIVERLNTAIDQIPFKDVAKDFNIINQITKQIIIPFDDCGIELAENLQSPYYFPSRSDYKNAQRLSVQVRDKVLDLLVGMGAVVDARGDGQFYILSNINIYSKYTGLSTDDPQFIESEKLIF